MPSYCKLQSHNCFSCEEFTKLSVQHHYILELNIVLLLTMRNTCKKRDFYESFLEMLGVKIQDKSFLIECNLFYVFPGALVMCIHMMCLHVRGWGNIRGAVCVTKA